MNVVYNRLIAETILFYHIVILNANISATKYTYTVGYAGQMFTITSVHISEQRHFYR